MREFVALALIPYGFALVAGASIGSFTAATVERTRTGRSLLEPSACGCGRPLRWSENVPILGWLKAKGATSCCEQPIPFWYLGTELAAAATAVTAAALLL